MSRATALAAILTGALAIDLAREKLFSPPSTPRPPLAPLATIPRDLLVPGWKCEDAPLPEETRRIAAVSDHVRRTYTKGDRTIWLYAGYIEGWDPRGIHHPGDCFPRQGLELEGEEPVTIPGPGIPKELRFQESRWRSAAGQRLYTLSSFYVRGRFEPSEERLYEDRLLGIDYFAVLTVSGSTFGSLEETRGVYGDLLRRAVPELLARFPD